MSAFMLYHEPRDYRPSDSYLAEHELDCDVFDEDVLEDEEYNYEDDYEIMTMPRTCHNCGCSFTLNQALYDYSYCLSQTYMDFSPYGSVCSGEYCGGCAAEMWEDEL